MVRRSCTGGGVPGLADEPVFNLLAILRAISLSSNKYAKKMFFPIRKKAKYSRSNGCPLKILTCVLKVDDQFSFVEVAKTLRLIESSDVGNLLKPLSQKPGKS